MISKIKSMVFLAKGKFSKSKFHIEQNKYVKFGFILGIILFVSIICIYKFHPIVLDKSLNNKTNLAMLHEITEIKNQLDDLSLSPGNKQQEFIQGISKKIESIQKLLIDIAKKDDVTKISSQLVLMKNDVNMQMNDIKKSVSEKLNSKEYLEPEALPFQIIAVDVISGFPYVSVNYANHVIPLGTSDILAGWRLVIADFDTNSAEFVNEKNQYVKVNLQG